MHYGCDSGFGNRLAFRLNSKGFRVYACVLDTNSTGAQDLSNKCQFKDEICIVRMDVTIDEDIDRCHKFVVADLQTSGRVLWSVVNNAGVMTYGHLEWGKFSQYTKVFDVNVFGVVRVTRKFIPLIRESKGRLVFTTAQAGRVAYDNLGVYCMSKAAIIAFTDVLRREMRPFGVRVSTVEPLIFKTVMVGLGEHEISRNWSETDLPVREVYGQAYYERQIKIVNFLLLITRPNGNLDIVADDMVDAVASRRPNKYYTPVNQWWLHGYHRLLRITPQCFIDYLFYRFISSGPIGIRLARLNSKGFRVYACVLDTESTGAQDLSNKCKFKDEICIVRMDVTIGEDIDRCHEFVVADLKTSGRVLWSVVNNAGVATYGHLEWGDFSQYTKLFDVNVFGVVRVTRKFIPLIRQSKGRFVITASMGGRIAIDNLGIYCMTKSAIIAFSDVLRREMRPFGVRVSTVEPMLFKTAMYDIVKPELNKNWSQTEGQVREAYGQPYFEQQFKTVDFLLTIAMGSKKLDIVVDDMVAAIVSRLPNRCYQPANRWLFN
ncbi:unnamed protein product, partial [Medioppia subpectinata]